MNHSRFLEWFKQHKKLLIITISILATLGIGFLIARNISANMAIERTAPEGSSVDAEPIIQLKKSPLTGIEVSPELAERPVTAVVIENSPDARPQSSLHKAGLIFEAIAEGGITRFVAFYQEERPELIGPVRSLRPYFIDWVLAFDAGIAHVGGSQQALQEIRDVNGRDLDQFSNGSSFYRSTDRFAPHNVYTTSDLLDGLMQSKGYTSSTFDALPRKEDSPAEIPAATNITLNISSPLYNPVYTYEQASNSYLRAQAGEPHIDRETGQQLKPKVVVALKVPHAVIAGGRLQLDIIGNGEAVVFQDGIATVGTWSKGSRDAQIQLADSAGQPISLNAGQTWISAVPTTQTIEY